eukprot:2306027-Pyramimonas_sp.AAC.1
MTFRPRRMECLRILTPPFDRNGSARRPPMVLDLLIRHVDPKQSPCAPGFSRISLEHLLIFPSHAGFGSHLLVAADGEPNSRARATGQREKPSSKDAFREPLRDVECTLARKWDACIIVQHFVRVGGAVRRYS